jgi:hypothetical protein
MKRLCYTLLIATTILLGGTSCKKTVNTPGATMSATVGGSNVSFSVTVSNSNGVTIIQGASSSYTMTIVLKTLSAGIFTLGTQASTYYATVSDNFGNSYSTDGANTGQITLTQNQSNTSLYNATFYFTANETAPNQGGGNLSVTNGSFSNI